MVAEPRWPELGAGGVIEKAEATDRSEVAETQKLWDECRDKKFNEVLG